MEGLPASHFLSKPFLEVDGWKQCGFAQEREALVFITGFNASTDGSAKVVRLPAVPALVDCRPDYHTAAPLPDRTDAFAACVVTVQILAQMLALGNFPAYLKPFIYSWPGGSLLKFGQAQIHGRAAVVTSSRT